MKLTRELLMTFLMLLVSIVNSYKILTVFPTTWKSHWKIGTSVVKYLAAAGHDVTFVSQYKFKATNVRNIVLIDLPQGKINKKKLVK